MQQPKFAIGDRVYVEGHDLAHYIIGVLMRPCYNLIAWEYWTGRALYGDHPISSFGSCCDVSTFGPFREEQVQTEADYLEQRKRALDAEIEATEKRLAELKSQKV